MIYIIPTDTCFGLACAITEIKDYEKIYKIKKRPYEKALAILVEDFPWLEKYTDLNSNQIEFLKNYDKPFTIVTNSNYVKIWINFVDEDTGEEFRNRIVYDKIAFRVANNNIEKKLIEKNGPLFLTSANITDKKEIYNVQEIIEEFGEYITKGIIEFLGENKGELKNNPPSEIFEFVGESLEQKFLRK